MSQRNHIKINALGGALIASLTAGGIFLDFSLAPVYSAAPPLSEVQKQARAQAELVPIDNLPPLSTSASTNVGNENIQPVPIYTLSLSKSFERADQNNREISVAQAQLAAARAQITIAAAIPNPVFNSTYGWGPAWEYIAAGNNQQVGWTEELQILGKRTKKIGVAKAQYVHSDFQLQAVRFSVHNRVRRSYNELTAAFAYSRLVEEQRLVAVKLLDIASKRYEAGKAPGSEVWQAKLGVLQFDTLRNLARGRILQDSAQLAQLLGEIAQRSQVVGTEGGALFQLNAQIDSTNNDSSSNLLSSQSEIDALPELGQLLPTAWSDRNDLRAAIQQAYVYQRAHSLAKTLSLPDPFVGFNFLYSTYKKSQPMYITGNTPFQPGFQLEVSHETPIFYQYQGQRRQAKATLLQQLKQNDFLTAQIAASAVSAYEGLVVAVLNLHKVRDELMPAAASVAQMSRRAYELGKSDLATAILAQQQYQQIRSSYLDAVVAYQTAWADLELAIGVPLRR